MLPTGIVYAEVFADFEEESPLKLSLVMATAFVLLVGCAASPPSIEVLRSAVPCCASLSELRYTELKVGEDLSAQIDESSQLFRFPEGNSYVLSLSLGGGAVPRSLLVKSYLSSTWLPSATMYFPKFQFLDRDRKPSRPAVSVQVTQANHFLKGGYYYTTLDVRADEQFVVVYSDATTHGNKLLYDNGSSAQTYPLSGSFVTVQGPGITHMIPSVAIGKLEVSLSAK